VKCDVREEYVANRVGNVSKQSAASNRRLLVELLEDLICLFPQAGRNVVLVDLMGSRGPKPIGLRAKEVLGQRQCVGRLRKRHLRFIRQTTVRDQAGPLSGVLQDEPVGSRPVSEPELQVIWIGRAFSTAPRRLLELWSKQLVFDWE